MSVKPCDFNVCWKIKEINIAIFFFFYGIFATRGLKNV